jgi:tetratricopeptide (TPR) repeat protein
LDPRDKRDDIRASLRQVCQDFSPVLRIEWATTGICLGNALQALGVRESGTVRLEDAVSAYREALQEFTRERVPLRWATVQMKLASVYCALFDKGAQPNHLDDALEAIDRALEEYRKAKADFYIEQAGWLREQIRGMKGKL